jgi:hypothetical protein
LKFGTKEVAAHGQPFIVSNLGMRLLVHDKDGACLVVRSNYSMLVIGNGLPDAYNAVFVMDGIFQSPFLVFSMNFLPSLPCSTVPLNEHFDRFRQVGTSMGRYKERVAQRQGSFLGWSNLIEYTLSGAHITRIVIRLFGRR